jgi:hypothetical protein
MRSRRADEMEGDAFAGHSVETRAVEDGDVDEIVGSGSALAFSTVRRRAR